jgi:hypothetical protein
MLKLMLTVVSTVALFALTASSALALSVKTEPSNVTCAAVSQPTHLTTANTGTGGCRFRLTTTGAELGGAFGSVVCNWAAEGRISGTGTGFLYNFTLTNCSPLTVTPCSEAAGTDPWPVKLLGEQSMELSLCVILGPFGTVACHLTGLKVTENPTHRYTLSTVANKANGHQDCEGFQYSYEGIWTQVIDAAHPAIEIVD